MSTSSAPDAHWTCYERPAVQREFVARNTDGTHTAQLLIQGVHCAACTLRIENSLRDVAGVISIEVNPLTTRAELRWQPDQQRLATLLETIAGLGYTPIPFTDNETQVEIEKARKLALRRLLIAGLGMMQVSSYAIALYAGAFQGMDPQIETFLRLISLLVATPIVVYSGAPFFTGALRSLRVRAMTMDVPVALAIGSAWLASVWNTLAGSGEVYFDSATMFVFFLSGTRYLEAAGRQRALSLTNALSQHIPCTTMRVRGETIEEIGVMELECGDTVLVPAGIAFPADGTLQTATTRIDESMLTGESLPVRRTRGETVAAGTLNLDESTLITVDKTGADTVFAQIGRLVTQADQEKPRLIQLTDRIAAVFVTAVLLLAAATGVYWWNVAPDRAFEIVLAVLVVTCPCALALATPAALTVATNRLARQGFLVRRAGVLPNLATVTHILMDKTGTLTENTVTISAIKVFAGLDDANALGVAAALEAHSAHPLARAFRDNPTGATATQVETVTAAGLQGTVNGKRYRIGSAEFVADLAAGSAQSFELAANHSRCVFLGDTTGVLARFDIVEQLRANSAQMVAQLHSLGISAAIASGDQPGPVAELAGRVGADNWRAQLRPEDKLAWLRDLQDSGDIVAALGDGINDSPVLAGANVSIAMGGGTSVAQHSADCIWLGERFTGFAEIFSIARATMRVVKQNLAWALCYNLVAIPLAVSGLLAPWIAALGMSLSSLLVMLNALRLSYINTHPTESQSSSCVKPAELVT